jgi:hypothetical protein
MICQSLQQQQLSLMVTLFLARYVGYIEAAKAGVKSYPCTHSTGLKGIDHGYWFRHNDDYGAPDSAGVRFPCASGCVSQSIDRLEED